MAIISLNPDTKEEEITAEFSSDVAPKTGRRGRQPYPRDEAGNIIRPDGSTKKAATGTRSRINLEEQISGFLTLVNMLVMAYKPIMALDQMEQVALAKALNQQAQVSPKFRKYLEKALSGVGSANLLGVVAMITVRRVARAGVLPADGPVKPQDIDNMCGALLLASTGKVPVAA